MLHLLFKLTDYIFLTWNQCGSGTLIFEKYISYVLFYFQFKMFNNLAQQKIISGLKVMCYSKINDLDRSWICVLYNTMYLYIVGKYKVCLYEL